jgi:hypothetical protein
MTANVFSWLSDEENIFLIWNFTYSIIAQGHAMAYKLSSYFFKQYLS